MPIPISEGPGLSEWAFIAGWGWGLGGTCCISKFRSLKVLAVSAQHSNWLSGWEPSGQQGLSYWVPGFDSLSQLQKLTSLSHSLTETRKTSPRRSLSGANG